MRTSKGEKDRENRWVSLLAWREEREETKRGRREGSEHTPHVPTEVRGLRSRRQEGACGLNLELAGRESFVQRAPPKMVLQAALDDHYSENHKQRPSLGDLAVAAAELDEHPLASRPEVLRRAAKEVAKRHPHADADDVLLWAEAQAAMTT